MRGRRHVEKDLPCQDAHRWHVAPGGLLIAAVADGAGSQPLSDIGSRVAVETATTTLLITLGEAFAGGKAEAETALRAALQRAHQALKAEAEARSAPTDHLATTLVLAAAGPDFVAALQVGDGCAVVAPAEGVIFALTTPENGEYADLTAFISDPASVAQAQFRFWRGAASGLALLTDGLQMQTLRVPSPEDPEWRPHAAFFGPFLDFARAAGPSGAGNAQLAAYLSSEKVQERSDDDITFIFAARPA